MLVVFGFALLVLAAAIVMLFAMFGELSSRVAESPSAPVRDKRIQPLDDARIGLIPDSWPASLPGPSDAVLLVLSTACGACTDVAAQLRSDHVGWDEVGVVISTSGRQMGEDFVETHGIGGFSHLVDEGGVWAREELGVQQSPTALVFRSGRLRSAVAFHDVTSLRSHVEEVDSQPAQDQEPHKEVV